MIERLKYTLKFIFQMPEKQPKSEFRVRYGEFITKREKTILLIYLFCMVALFIESFIFFIFINANSIYFLIGMIPISTLANKYGKSVRYKALKRKKTKEESENG